MFEELDQLLDITRTIESSPISNPMMEAEEDNDAVYVDYGDSATPFDAAPVVTKISSKASTKPGECSGNKTFADKKKGPLFEEDTPNEATRSDVAETEAPPPPDPNQGKAAEALSDATKDFPKIGDELKNMENTFSEMGDSLSSLGECAETPVEEGLGLGKISLSESVERGMGKEFVRMYKLECAGQTCAQQGGLCLGDVVHCGNVPALFVVKKADGQTVTAAKPTANPNELTNNDGTWPTFTFRASDIQPMLNASLDDVDNIVTFNDQALPFDGGTVDDSPMKVAQNDAKCNMVERIADKLDEILGMPYKDICCGKDPSCNVMNQPTEVVVINPDGSFGSTPKFGGYQVKIGD